MIKTVIFDIDNTIYSFKDCDNIAADKVAEYLKNKFDIDKEKTNVTLEKLKKEQKNRVGLDIGAIHSRVIRYQMLLEKFNLPVFPHTSILTRMYWDTMLENMKLENNLIEGIDFLRKNKIKVGICTDMTALIQHDKIERLGLSEKIDFIVSSEESGAEKPSEKILDLVIKKAKSCPNECLFIGDSIKKDVKGPMDYGMYALWYSKYTREKEINSTYFKENQLEIVDYTSLIPKDCGIVESAINIKEILKNSKQICKNIESDNMKNNKENNGASKIFEIDRF